jgi:PTS system nitrogen regulatory IIA component
VTAVPSLDSLISPDLIFPDLAAGDGTEALVELASKVAASGRVKPGEPLLQRLREREQLGSTAIGHGVAIPHCKLDGLSRVLVAVGVSRRGVDFRASDGKPVHLFFLVASPSRSPAEHLQSLAAISKWVKGAAGQPTPERVRALAELDDATAIADAIRGGGA